MSLGFLPDREFSGWSVLCLCENKMGIASELPSAHASSELKMQSQSVSPD